MDFALKFISYCFVCMLFIDKVTATDNCKILDTCSCRTDSGFVVDLKGLVRPTEANPRLQAKSEYYTYNYEPCKQLPSCGSATDNVSVCQQSNSGSDASNAGTVISAIFKGDPHDGTLSIHYSGVQGGVTRTTLIALKCGHSEPTLTVISEAGLTYHLELVTDAVCIPTSPKHAKKKNFTWSLLMLLICTKRDIKGIFAYTRSQLLQYFNDWLLSLQMTNN